MSVPIFFLSKDQLYLMDDLDRNIYIRIRHKHSYYYQPIAVESEGFEKVCTGSRTISVCILWDDKHKCIAFKEVNICTSWTLIPRGYSNIS